MSDPLRSLYLSTDEDFEGPFTPKEVQERISDGVRKGKDIDSWDLYEKADFDTKVVVEFGRDFEGEKK